MDGDHVSSKVFSTNHVSRVRKSTSSNCRLGLDGVELFSSLDVPKPHSVVCCSRYQMGSVPTRVQGPAEFSYDVLFNNFVIKHLTWKKCTNQTAPWCPSKVPSLSPLREYQTLGWWSLADENNRSPSLLYLICVIERSWPCIIRGLIFTLEGK